MSEKISWDGHEFSIHVPLVNWSAAAGIYVFTGLNQAKKWVPLYIGQASSLAERLANHERWSEAQRLGATHIHAKVVPHQSQRDQIEKQLIQAFQPRLNTQLK
jgi:excinuclease UvrABC nuclease subunit